MLKTEATRYDVLDSEEFFIRHIRTILARFEVNGVVVAPIGDILTCFQTDTVVAYFVNLYKRQTP